MSEVAVRPKFQLLPDLQRHEVDELAESIRRFGIKVPVVFDEDGNILDGHHRVMIADSLGVEYPKQIENGLSVEEKRILAAQLNAARRHMTDAQRVHLGMQIEPDIAEVARKRSELNLKRGPDSPSGTLVPLGGEIGRTRDEVARTVGLGTGRTYERHKETMQEVEDEAPDLLPEIEAGRMDMPEVRRELNERRPHVSHNSGENEWYTPVEYIDAAREVLGSIDVDPASSDIANERVKAASYFTKDDNGLAHEWHGNVWMNPPYAQPLIAQFCEKVVEEFEAGRVTAAIVLVNNATETRWFQGMTGSATAISYPAGRIRFIDPNGAPSGAPLQGQSFIYFGNESQTFLHVFRQFGFVTEVW